jgi:hypothetical protein
MSLPSFRLLAVTVLAAVVSATVPAASGQSDVPEVGSCHLYSWRDFGALTEPRDPVSCDAEHTAVTMHVKRLRGEVDWHEPNRLISRSTTPCLRAIVRTLGGGELTYLKTAYKPAWFLPTKAQRASGAKWIRCDIVKYSVRSLLPLGTDLHLGDEEIPDDVARCLNPEGLLTPCSVPHRWRATGFLQLAGALPPSQEESRQLANRRCPAKVTTRDFTYRVSLDYEWRAGIKGLICYSRTRG